MVLGVAAHELRGTAATRPGPRRQRCHPWWPYRGLRWDTGDIAQPQSADLLAQPGIAAISGVHQHNAARQTGGVGRPDLLQRDLRLGQKSNRLGDASRGAAHGVGRPLQRQIQPPGDRQARRMVGQRQADRDLAVVLFAELAAILTRHPDRMTALLGKAGVVDDPGFDRAAAFDEWQGQLLDPAENPLIRPRCVGNEMQQRLVLGRDSRRCRYRRDRLDALAFAWHQQAQAVITQRLRSICMPDHLGERIDIGREPFLPVLAHAPSLKTTLFEDISDSHPRAYEFLTQ
jgi:hypothetical protein